MEKALVAGDTEDDYQAIRKAIDAAESRHNPTRRTDDGTQSLPC